MLLIGQTFQDLDPLGTPGLSEVTLTSLLPGSVSDTNKIGLGFGP